MGRTIGYFMNNWKMLTAYLGDGKTLNYNNPVERAFRVSAIGKRNLLFHGTHEGGQWAAILYSFSVPVNFIKSNPL